MIPKIDLQALVAKDAGANHDLLAGIQEYGFLIVHNTSLSAADVVQVTDMYRQFFHLPEAEKAHVSMAKTGSNRGWGASGSEQVDPNANPDYKEVFDSGYVPSPMHPYAAHSVYAPNQWPEQPADFERVIKNYYAAAMRVAMDVLRAIADALELDRDYFTDKFSHPMALL